MNNIGEKKNTPRGHWITFKLGMLDRLLAWDRTARNYLYEDRYIYPFDIYRSMPGYQQFLIFVLNPLVGLGFVAILGFLILKF